MSLHVRLDHTYRFTDCEMGCNAFDDKIRELLEKIDED